LVVGSARFNPTGWPKQPHPLRERRPCFADRDELLSRRRPILRRRPCYISSGPGHGAAQAKLFHGSPVESSAVPRYHRCREFGTASTRQVTALQPGRRIPGLSPSYWQADCRVPDAIVGQMEAGTRAITHASLRRNRQGRHPLDAPCLAHVASGVQSLRRLLDCMPSSGPPEPSSMFTTRQ
jgi:hypothetical protein